MSKATIILCPLSLSDYGGDKLAGQVKDGSENRVEAMTDERKSAMITNSAAGIRWFPEDLREMISAPPYQWPTCRV